MADKNIPKEQSLVIESSPFLEKLAGNYTRFLLNGEEYAIKTDYVTSVFEKPTIRVVPKAPEFIEGIANIEGKIVPILNPFIRFDIQKQNENGNLLLILIKIEGVSYGVLTEEVTANTSFSASSLEMVNPLIKKKESPFIAGVAKLQDKLIYLLDLEGFVFSGFEMERKDSKYYKEFVANQKSILSTQKKQDFTRYLLFHVAHQEYCIAIDKLATVVSANNIQISKNNNEGIYGIIKDEDRIIPVLDLQKKFNLDIQTYDVNSKVVVFEVNKLLVGIIVNETREIINLYPEEIKTAPDIFDYESHITGVGLLDNAERLVVILNEVKLVNSKEMAEFEKIVNKEKGSDVQNKTKEHKNLMLIFSINAIEFAVPIEKVREVINYQKVKEIPKAANYIKGVFSYRGDLATAIDLAKRLELKGHVSEKYFIVIEDNGVTFGIATEKIEEILDVDSSYLKVPPNLVKGIDSKFMDKLIALPNSDRTPIVLNVSNVLSK
jgi:purine-binding chemotaxis protein CheW